MKLFIILKHAVLYSFLFFCSPLFSAPILKTDLTFPQSQKNIELLFAPDDKPTLRLIEEINKAKMRIYVAIYMLTDMAIAKALTEAKKNGIDVQIVTDRASTDSPFGKIHFLKKNDIIIHVFNGEKTTKPIGKDNNTSDPIMMTEAELQTPFKKASLHTPKQKKSKM